MDDQQMQRFLADDFRDALTWLCIGGVTWHVHPEDTDRDHLRGIGMFTALVQARALYEFFLSSRESDDDARAHHFEPQWPGGPPTSRLYEDYMSSKKPAQKRIFHLVYGRSEHSGGDIADESKHLKNQVLAFVQDLVSMARSFGGAVREPYRSLVEAAIAEALSTSDALTGNGRNPLRTTD